MKRARDAAAASPASDGALDGMLHELLSGGAAGGAGAGDALALDGLLGDFEAGGADEHLWNAPDLFGSLAPGLQCSEACHRPGQRCIDPSHADDCSKCVPLRREAAVRAAAK